MLARKYRATKILIGETIQKGKTIQGDFVYAKYLKNQVNKPFFAIVVAKKVEKTSVGRHHIKRLVSQCIEDILLKPAVQPTKTIVFFAKKTEKKPVYSILKKDIAKIADQIY